MKLYAARSIKGNFQDTRVKGTQSEGEDLGWREVKAPVRRESPSVQEADLFLETRAREKRSLDHQDIPLEYKDSVRKYFDSIEVDSP